MLSRHKVIPLIVLAVGVAWALPAAAVEITGQVRNATTGQPEAGASVNLLALRGMMVPIRETQTNQEGRYRFVVAANPSERFLVQVPFQGVNYHAPAFATGEHITADVEVYESGAAPSDISVEGHTIFLEPHSDHMRVTESYAVHNHSRPLRTFAPDGSSFTFLSPPPWATCKFPSAPSAACRCASSPNRLRQKTASPLTTPFAGRIRGASQLRRAPERHHAPTCSCR